MTDENKIQRKSAFLKSISDFAVYTRKEYIEGSGGDLGMLIVAGDDTVEIGKTAVTMATMGDTSVINNAMGSLLEKPFGKEIFRHMMKSADMSGDIKKDIASYKNQLRRLYFAVGVCAAWTICCILLWVFGIIGFAQSIASILLMLMTLMNACHDIARTRRKMKSATQLLKRQVLIEEDRRVCSIFGDFIRHLNSDDDE